MKVIGIGIGIGSNFLKKSIQNSICKPLSIIFNKSFETGTIPKHMKIAKVIPIYKCKEKSKWVMHTPTQWLYRPISLLPSISKIIEKLVHKRLYSFCENNNILNDNQYGFRPKHSTIDAVSNWRGEQIYSWYSIFTGEKYDYICSVSGPL